MLFTVGDHVISNAVDHVLAMTGPDQQTTRLARNHFALPTFDDTSVWVRGSLYGVVGTSLLLRLRLDGTVTDRIVVPAVAQPRAGIADGVLLSTPSGIHIASGDGVRRITASGELLAVSADRRLAWLDCAADLSCYIVIGTLDDPDQVRVPIAPNEVTTGDIGLPLGRFSPDGRQLALPLLRFGVGEMNMMNAHGAVAILDTATGSEMTRIQNPLSEAYEGSPFEWSPDGRFLFVGLGSILSAWDADTGDLTELDDRPNPIRGLAVTRS
jgi:WD40 repeat protein